MKRYIAVAVITGYLGALSWGIISHTLSVGNVSHPGMYYVVWDMFCGWSGYENRQHLIAEGVSGDYYSLTPSPWGEYQPYGPAYRPDYDSFAVHSGTIAKNVLRQTKHEPIVRVYLVEENWSKRYNLPDYLWERQFEEKKDPVSYYHTRVVYDDKCLPIQVKSNWASSIYSHNLAKNSRLAKFRQNATPYIAVDPGSMLPPAQTATREAQPSVLGN